MTPEECPIAYNPPEGKDYKWYISGIFPANWGMDYATYLPPFTGTKNNHCRFFDFMQIAGVEVDRIGLWIRWQ